MKAWQCLRFVCSLSLGIVAGMLMWMLPQPSPTFTLSLPAPAPGDEGAPFALHAISSDARHAITFGKQHTEKWPTIHVWDRQRGLDKPMIVVPLDQERRKSCTAMFSPDEQTLAVAVWYWPKKGVPLRNDLVWFDLRTGAKIKGVELEMDHILFAPNGKLMYVNAGVVRDVQSGEGLRKLDTTIDGFEQRDSHGEFVIYRKEDQTRLYSYLSGQKRSGFTLQGQTLTINGLSDDGLIVSATGWPQGHPSPRYQLRDASDTTSRDVSDADFGQFSGLSPDGTLLISYGTTQRHSWLTMWWPISGSDVSYYVTRWKTNERLAEFRNANHVCFSPRGNQLAVMRADLAIDVYDFPLRKPWGSIVAVALLAGVGTWGIGWLWSRWRVTRTPAAPASPPPSA